MLTRMYINCILEKGALIHLNKDQFNYLGNVLRKHNGDKISVFNGISGEWEASITFHGKRSIHLLIEKKILEQLRDSENFKPNPTKKDKGFFERVKEYFN